MADETITTPVTTADVDTSSSVEPTDTTTDDVNVSDDTSTQDEEPTSNDGTAVTEEQEPTLYAGKYKSIEELEKGYKEAEKSFTRASEFEKKYNELVQRQQQEQARIQQQQLQQAQQQGFNSVEAQQIANEVQLAEFEAYANNINTIEPEFYENVRSNLLQYYQTGHKQYLEEAKRYFPSDFIENVALAKNNMTNQLNKLVQFKQHQLNEQREKALSDNIKAKYAEFLSDTKDNKPKAEMLRALCNVGAIQSLEDMDMYVTQYNAITASIKEQAIKEYLAQQDIEKTKAGAQIDASPNTNINENGMPTYDELMSMSREDYSNAVDKWGLEKLLSNAEK